MKKLVLCYIVALLGVIILGLAIYFFSARVYNRQADVVFAVGTLCLSAALLGAIIAQSKVHVSIFSSLLIVGIVILGLDTASLIHLEVQDMYYGRTIPIFELFIVWLLGALI